MKRKGKYVTGAIVAGALLLAAAGISGRWQSSETQKNSEERKRINFIAAIANNGYWGRAADGAMQTADQNNMEVKCLGQTNLGSQNLLDNLEISINSDLDGIITYGLNQSPEFQTLLEEADEKGIPVVLIDSDVETEHKLCYIGIDDYGSGWMAGKEMAEECNGKAEILMIISEKNITNQIERLKGFRAAIQDYPDMKIVDMLECGSSLLTAQRLVTKVMEEQPYINAIFCAEGMGTGACCYVMEKQNRKVDDSMHIIGYDYNSVTKKAIEEGSLSACIQQDSRQMGELAAEVLHQYLNEGIRPDATIHTHASLIRKDNMQEAEKIDSKNVEVEWNYY